MTGDRLTVLIVASVLIAAGVFAGLPRAARLGQAGSDRPTRRLTLDGLWTILPIAFLIALVILAAKAAS